jgi:hypothetical protein
MNQLTPLRSEGREAITIYKPLPYIHFYGFKPVRLESLPLQVVPRTGGKTVNWVCDQSAEVGGDINLFRALALKRR